MAYVKLYIPDGDTCTNCRFNPEGTCVCECFSCFLEENSDYTAKLKCKACVEMCKKQQEEETRERAITPGIYRHFKGKKYRVSCIAMHTESSEPLVIYQALYGDMQYFARPLTMFASKVDRNKYPDADQEYRFVKL